MILPQSYIQSLILMILSLLLMGSWPAIFKWDKGRRFEIFGVDFGLGAFLAALLLALTVGNLGYDGFSFVDDVMHAGKSQWVIGFSAGTIFSLGTMLLLGAISVTGLTVATTIAFGLSLILGVGVPQLLTRTFQGGYLFGAFVLILGAILCAAIAHNAEIAVRIQLLVRQAQAANRKLMHLPTSVKGLLLAIASGLLYSAFYPIATRSRQAEIGLGPYSSIFLISLGIFMSAPVLYIFFINLPVEGEPLDPSSFLAGPVSGHFKGILSGAMWSLGALIPLVIAAADPSIHVSEKFILTASFSAPLLTSLWGFVVFRELRRPGGNRPRTVVLVILLLLAASVALLALARTAVEIPA